MSASAGFSEANGVGEDITDAISNINFGSSDDPNLVAASNTIVAGENSYEKFICVKFTGTWTEISNMKFWKSAGVYKTEEDIHAAAQATFATPVATTSSIATSTIPTTSGTALELKSAEGEDVVEYGASGVTGYTDYVCLQLQTTVSTETGAVNTKTFTFQWDET